ncbi:MAG: TonB-dependent receptor [Bacteroidia bacterium]|nr:TonB-dependent receptor [Bacteroidia bacterium]
MRILSPLIIVSVLWAQEERLTGMPPALAPVKPSATICGRIIEAQTGEPLMGVQVKMGRSGTFTDEKGYFCLDFYGADTLVAFLLGYRTLKVPLSKAISNLSLRLEPIESTIEEVKIITDAGKETEAGVFLERLRSLEIGELYSQELIMKRSTDFFVPNVLRRLPGVSLLSGRFVSIRGMGERYNAFAFWAAYPAWLSYDASFGELEHLITTLLGRVEVRKFWTPELLGHFGGGMVDFQLPTAATDGFQVSFTTEVDAGVIGRPFAYIKPPYKSLIPPNFPSPAQVQASEGQGRPSMENFEYGRMVNRYTVPDTLPFGLPGGLLTLSFDKHFSKGGIALRAAYSRRYLSSRLWFQEGEFVEEGGRRYYKSYLNAVSLSPLHIYSHGGGASWYAHYRPTANHSLTMEGIFLINTTQKSALEEANYLNPEVDSTELVYSWYPSFQILQSWMGIIRPGWSFRFGQWQGRLQLGLVSQGNDIPQTGAMNYIRYPGQNDTVYEHELYGESEIYAQVWTSRVRALQAYAHPYIERRWDIGQGWLQLRIGGWHSRENQTFRGRQLGFMTDTAGGGPHVLPPETYSLHNVRHVYDPSNVHPGGWYLIDRTGDFHRHTGFTQLSAGYGWIRFSWMPQWEVLTGIRYEAWQRQIRHIPIATERETTFYKIDERDWLPAFLLKYQINEQQTFRLGGNLTLIRPPLPTQVPLRYFDYFWGFYWEGSTSVSTGRSWNVDLRWEWLRNKDNIIAVGLFYKRLRNLPEVYLVPASYMLTYAYASRNRRWGEVIGLELEVRRTIWEHERDRLWTYLTLTVSESGLERPVWQKIGWLEGRLQGHAPLVGNAGLLYARKRYEIASFLTYTAMQIWAIGFNPYIFPHVVERGRLMIEAQATYHLSDRWELRLAVWDFLNQPYRRTQQLGNASRFRAEQDAQPVWERWAYRFYFTVRYRIGF